MKDEKRAEGEPEDKQKKREGRQRIKRIMGGKV